MLTLLYVWRHTKHLEKLLCTVIFVGEGLKMNQLLFVGDLQIIMLTMYMKMYQKWILETLEVWKESAVWVDWLLLM